MIDGIVLGIQFSMDVKWLFAIFMVLILYAVFKQLRKR